MGTQEFKRTRFTAGDDEWFVVRNYLSGGGNIISLNWDEAEELRDWLNENLKERADSDG